MAQAHRDVQSQLLAAAQRRANSAEGLRRLVKALLLERRLTECPEITAFIRALRHYVYLKRCREVYLKTWDWNSWRVWGRSAVQADEVEMAQQAKNGRLWALGQVIGHEAAEILQRRMGPRLSLRAFRMGSQRSEDVS